METTKSTVPEQRNTKRSNAATLPPLTEVTIWLRILLPDGDLPQETARAILDITFPENDKERMHALLEKAKAGTLTSDEQADAESYERVGALLSTLKSKARQVLRKTGRRS